MNPIAALLLLVFAVAAQQAVQFLGMPEGNLALAQAARDAEE